MLQLREKILKPFIKEAGFEYPDYFAKLGVKLTDRPEDRKYTSSDKIICELAKSFRNCPSLFKTFGYIYQCYHRTQLQQYLQKYDEKERKLKPLKIETIRSYERKIVKLLHKLIFNDHRIKKQLIERIKEEYEEATHKKRS